MNKLISASLKQKTISMLADVPEKWLTDFEQEVFQFIFNYTSEYKKVPKTKRVLEEFPTFFYVETEEDDILRDIFDKEIRERRESILLTKMDALVTAMRRGLELDLERELGALNDLILDTTGILLKYSTFDRKDGYFRRPGFSMGLKLIDKVTGGLSPGDFLLVAGRLGSGKTFFAIWLTYMLWLANKKILFISKEMLPVDIFARLDGFVGHFDPLLIRKREIDPEILEGVAKIAREGAGEVFVPYKMVKTVGQLTELAKRVQADIIILDGVYLMTSTKSYAQRWERVAAVSNEIKEAATDLEIPIVGVTQIKRVGGREDYDPEDLAYSDALGQDADFILALLAQDKSIVEAQLIKNRFGPEITTLFSFDYEEMKVVDESIETTRVVEFGEPK